MDSCNKYYLFVPEEAVGAKGMGAGYRRRGEKHDGRDEEKRPGVTKADEG